MTAGSSPGTRACLVCLRPTPDAYHVGCLRKLFCSDVPPAIDLTEATLQTVALATLGHTILPGVQPKVSLGLVRDRRRTLRISAGGEQRYILKPQNAEFPSLPENEHVSMQIARLFWVVVPQRGLVRLADGSLAYLGMLRDPRARRIMPLGVVAPASGIRPIGREPQGGLILTDGYDSLIVILVGIKLRPPLRPSEQQARCPSDAGPQSASCGAV